MNMRALWGMLLCVALLSPLAADSTSGPTAQIISGTVDIPSNQANGNSVYSISYSYPNSANVGTNFSVGVTFGVANFTGYKVHVETYDISVLLTFSNGLVVNGTVSVSNSSAIIYPGGVANPANVVLPLTSKNTGVAPGQATLTNVTIGFYDTVWNEPPVSNFVPEYGSAVVGQVLVSNPSPRPLWQPELLIVAGAVLLGSGLLVRRTRSQVPTSTNSPA